MSRRSGGCDWALDGASGGHFILNALGGNDTLTESVTALANMAWAARRRD
jgi:hypothetical protein